LSQDLTTTGGRPGVSGMLAGRRDAGGMARAGGNVGSISVEQDRAVAEAIGAIMAAQSVRRDSAQAAWDVAESCKRMSFAERAFYNFSRGGSKVNGLSIRAAEELARCYGNLDYGIRELSRFDGGSEMQAYCLDLEKNVKSTQNFTVKHLRDKTGGAEELTSERDIYEITANMGARRLRARILAILPAWYVEDAIAECKKTLAGGNGAPVADRIKKMINIFGALGVTPDMIKRRLDHDLDATTPDELAEMHGLYLALKENQTTVRDEFPAAGAGAGAAGGTAAAVNAEINKEVGSKTAAESKASGGKANAKLSPEAIAAAQEAALREAEGGQKPKASEKAAEAPKTAAATTAPADPGAGAGDAEAGAGEGVEEEDPF
jgi:hypothetical protein